MDIHPHDCCKDRAEGFGVSCAKALALLPNNRYKESSGAAGGIKNSVVTADLQLPNDPLREPVRRVVFAEIVPVFGIDKLLVQPLENVFVQEVHIVAVERLE